MALQGKTAVITGAINGIGFATAKHYLKAGIKGLALLDIQENEDKVQQLTNEFSDANVIFLAVDITKRDDVERTFENILEKLQRIDIVVNCAGILREDDIQRIVNTNLVGLMYVTLVAINSMSQANGGHGGIIVNIASIVGTEPSPGIPIYSATKHGVVGFTRSLVHDKYFAKQGIKFTVICPGLTDTVMLWKSGEHSVFPESSEIKAETIKKVAVQTADECGEIIAKITPVAENGSMWVVDGGKFAEFKIPTFCDL